MAKKKSKSKKPAKKAAKKTPKKKASAKKATKARPAKPAKKAKAARRGEYRRQASNRQSRADSSSIREVGPLPKCANKRRRNFALKSMERFARTYFAESRFTLEFSADHLEACRSIDAAIDDHALFALGMPRGSGKTSLAEVGAIKAVCSGKHPFVVLLGSDKDAAVEMLDSIKIEFELNELLAADFPEICYPIQALDGINHRCAGQTVDGQRTRIVWGADRIVLPTVAGSPASGACMRALGITGRIRGLKFRQPAGVIVRPSFVIGDDLQTDESAWSDPQCAHRERILKGAVLGLAGPGKSVGGVFPITVIRELDLADRILDPKLNPEFQGKRFKLLYEFPRDLELWEKYNERRLADLAGGDKRLTSATKFYKRHRKKLDAGAVVGWKERFDRDAGELSAIQHAMNLYLRDPYAFACEFNNTPPKETDQADVFLNAAAIAARVNEFERLVVPPWATTVVSFVDVQGALLYYVTCAFSDKFTGATIDYGTWPKQSRRYFTLAGATSTFAGHCEATTQEGRIREALINLVEHDLAIRDYQRTDGATLRAAAVLVDEGWEKNTITGFVQSSAFANVWPSRGVGIGVTGTPITEDRPKPGQKIGDNWKIPAKTHGGVRYVLFDANYWKTFAQRRLATPIGDGGSLSLFAGAPATHRMIADHLTAETPKRATSESRCVYEWRLKPNKPDNHLADGVVGCCVAASMAGCRLPSAAPQPRKRRRGRRNVSYL